MYASASVFRLTDSPLEDQPLDTRHGPSVLEGMMFEVLDSDPKQSRAVLRILSMQGRGAHLCWVHSKPTGPNDPALQRKRLAASV